MAEEQIDIETDQEDPQDPFAKYGGKQVKQGEDPFKRYGGKSIEPVKKKDFFNQDPYAYLKQSGGTSSPTQSQSQEGVNQTDNLPSTSTLKIGATDARVGGEERFENAATANKGVAGMYNGLVESAARLAGGISQMGEDFERKVHLQTDKNEVIPYGQWRKEQVQQIEQLRSPISTKEEERKLGEFDIHKKTLGQNIKALAFTTPSMVADVMAGTASGGATFFAQGVNDAAEEIESNPLTKDLSENQKLGYVYTSGAVNALLMKFNFDQAIKGTGIDKLITKNITSRVVSGFEKAGIKAAQKDIDEAVAKEVTSFATAAQRFGLKTAVGALTGAGTGATMAASHGGLQALVNAQAGKEIFDTSHIKQDIENQSTQLGIFSALTGSTSSLKHNLDYVNKVKENVAHLPEEHQAAYVTESLTEKLANEKANKLTDPTLIKQQKDIAKEAHEVKEKILAGENPDEIVTESQQKKIDEEEKRKTDLQRLQEDFELENKKLNEKRDAISQEIDNTDGRKTENKDKLKDLKSKLEEHDVKIKRAKEDFEKAQAKLQPKEEKVESPSPVPEGGAAQQAIDKVSGMSDHEKAMRKLELEHEFAGKGIYKDTQTYNSDNLSLSVGAQAGSEQTHVTVSTRSNETDSGWIHNKELSKAFDTELEALEYAKSLKDKDQSQEVKQKSVPEGGGEVKGGVSFKTHTGEEVSGKRLDDALNKVADDWAEMSRKIREEDKYASHVSEKEKDEALAKGLERAEEIRRGENIDNFTIQQRINTELTGESVPLFSDKTTTNEQETIPKGDTEKKQSQLQADRDAKIEEAHKPDIKIDFIPAKELVDSKDPVGNKLKHTEIKEKFKDLKKIIDCLWP